MTKTEAEEIINQVNNYTFQKNFPDHKLFVAPVEDFYSWSETFRDTDYTVYDLRPIHENENQEHTIYVHNTQVLSGRNVNKKEIDVDIQLLLSFAKNHDIHLDEEHIQLLKQASSQDGEK